MARRKRKSTPASRAASQRNLVKARAARSKASSPEHPMVSKNAPTKLNRSVFGSSNQFTGGKVRGLTPAQKYAKKKYGKSVRVTRSGIVMNEFGMAMN